MLHINELVWRAGEFRLQVDRLILRTGITLLVGPNGAGKTSFMKLLATAVSPQEGTILYGAHSVREALPLIRRNIGFMPSGLELYEEMSPRKLLRYMAELKGVEDRVEEERLLEDFGLAALAAKSIRSLSMGQKMRLGIAQAMLGRPAFLFLDEPLNYLDSLEQKRVQFLLSKYAAKAVILLISHEMNEWEPHANRILHLDGGRVVEDLTPTEWKRSLPFQVYEGSLPEKELEELDPVRVLRLTLQEGEASIRVVGPAPREGFRQVEPTLEDAYFVRRWKKERTPS